MRFDLNDRADTDLSSPGIASTMIGALAVLLGFQLIGEVAVQLSGIPAPGPVVGMVLLLLALQWHGAMPDALRTTAQTLLSHLSLLFVPAGVGIIQHGARLAEEWLALTVALVVSTLVTVAITALMMRAFIRRRDGTQRHG